ncbi:MAG: hypothetical protein AB7F32_03705 [Victivallaceae bacterium]
MALITSAENFFLFDNNFLSRFCVILVYELILNFSGRYKDLFSALPGIVSGHAAAGMSLNLSGHAKSFCLGGRSGIAFAIDSHGRPLFFGVRLRELTIARSNSA